MKVEILECQIFSWIFLDVPYKFLHFSAVMSAIRLKSICFASVISISHNPCCNNCTFTHKMHFALSPHIAINIDTARCQCQTIWHDCDTLDAWNEIFTEKTWTWANTKVRIGRKYTSVSTITQMKDFKTQKLFWEKA